VRVDRFAFFPFLSFLLNDSRFCEGMRSNLFLFLTAISVCSGSGAPLLLELLQDVSDLLVLDDVPGEPIPPVHVSPGVLVNSKEELQGGISINEKAKFDVEGDRVKAWVQQIRESLLGRRKLFVFGEDDRKVLGPTAMIQRPASSVGIFRTRRGYCTATIISRFTIITNRHCVANAENRVSEDFFDYASFQLAFSDGISTFSTNFTWMRWSGTNSEYALLVTEDPIGDVGGVVEIKWVNKFYFADPQPAPVVGLIAYNFDFVQEFNKPSGDIGCIAYGLGSDGNVWNGVRHFCDQRGGSSGAAIFQGLSWRFPDDKNNTEIEIVEDGPFLVGLNFAESSEYNFMIPSADFRGVFREAIDQEPHSTTSSAQKNQFLILPAFVVCLFVS